MAAEKKESVNYKNTIVKLFLLVLFMLAFIALVTNVFKNQNRKTAERVFNDNVNDSADHIEKNMEETLYIGRSAVRAAALILGHDDLSGETDYTDTLNSLLDSTAANGMYIADIHGNMISKAGIQLADSTGEWNDEVLKGKEILDVYSIKLGRSYGEQFVISSPIKKDGEVIGSITAFFPMTIFTDAANTYRIEWNAGNLLIDKDGNVMAEYGLNSFFPGDSIYDNEKFVFKGMVSDTGFSGYMEGGKAGNMSCAIDGVDYFARYTPVLGGKWYLLSIISKDRRDSQIESYESVFSQFGTTFGIGFFIFVIAGSIVLYSELRSDTRSRKKLKNDAEIDLLTGVYNKLSTEKYISEYMEMDGSPGLFYIIDIDDFKTINDRFGHAFGDEVLKAVGKHLITEFRATDIIGRLGGDEFCVFLKHLSNEDEKNKQIERMTGLFEDIYAGEHVKFNPTASIGGAEFPKYGSTFEEIYKAADSALYEVKKNGKNGLKIYERDGD